MCICERIKVVFASELMCRVGNYDFLFMPFWRPKMRKGEELGGGNDNYYHY